MEETPRAPGGQQDVEDSVFVQVEEGAQEGAALLSQLLYSPSAFSWKTLRPRPGFGSFWNNAQKEPAVVWSVSDTRKSGNPSKLKSPVLSITGISD